MSKRIYKIRSQKKLCGVCAGVAEYFDLDPTLVRVLWAAISLGYGVGVIAYIICAVVFPDKSNCNPVPKKHLERGAFFLTSKKLSNMLLTS